MPRPRTFGLALWAVLVTVATALLSGCGTDGDEAVSPAVSPTTDGQPLPNRLFQRAGRHWDLEESHANQQRRRHGDRIAGDNQRQFTGTVLNRDSMGALA